LKVGGAQRFSIREEKERLNSVVGCASEERRTSHALRNTFTEAMEAAAVP
jgi:hypothetical protein